MNYNRFTKRQENKDEIIAGKESMMVRIPIRIRKSGKFSRALQRSNPLLSKRIWNGNKEKSRYIFDANYYP